MASPLPSLRNEQPIVSVTIDPSAQLKSEQILGQLTALVKIHQDEIEREERISLPDDVERKKNQVIRRQVQEQSSFPGQQERTQSLRNLSLGGIMRDTFGDMKDQAMNRFRNNRFVSFARRAGNAYGVLTGRKPMFGGGGGNTGELSQKELSQQREGKSDVKEIIYQLEQLNEKFDGFEQTPEQKKEEGKGFFRTIADAFLGFKIFDFLKNTLFGAGVVGAGGLGLKALAGTGMFVGAAAAATKAGAVLAKMGLFGAIAGGLIGTIGDSLVAWSNSETWKASDTKRIIGSILGGTGGGLSAAFRGLAFAGIGFKIGSALFPPFGGIIGAILGGSLGAIAGFIGGQKIAEGLEELGDWFSDTWKSFIYKLLGKPLDVALDSAINVSNNLPKGSPLQTELDSAIDQSKQIEGAFQQADKNLRDAQQEYKENPTDENYQKVKSALKERAKAESARDKNSEQLQVITEDADTLQKTSEIISSPDASVREKNIATLSQNKVVAQRENRQLQNQLESDVLPAKPLEVVRAEQYIEENSAFFGDLFRDDKIDREMVRQEQIVKDYKRDRLEKRNKIRDQIRENEEKIKATEDEQASEVRDKVFEQSPLPPPSLLAKPKEPVLKVPNPKVKELLGENLDEQQTDEQQADEEKEPAEKVETEASPFSESSLFTEAKELIRGEEVSMGDPVFEAKLDPNPTWEDGETPRFQIGYGSNFIDGKNIVEDGMKLRGFEEDDKAKMKAHAEELLNKDVTRIFGEFKSKQPKNYETFKKLDPSRQIVLLSTMHQLGAAGLGKFIDSWPKIRAAVDAKTEEQPFLWQEAAKEMRDSLWYNEQTPDRAGRVTQVIEHGGDVIWDGGVTYEASPVSAAIGHMAYEPETIHVGDYKGIKNNPEVTMPMSDLEERVLSTVTRMMSIRDDASVINNNVQMMNYESRMKSLLASSEQISKRVQAKDDLESASRTMTIPPIINSSVDNSNVSTTNQSVIVNRPVENRHNPFLTIS